MRKDSEVLQQALRDLQALHPKKIDLGLGRIKRVLKKLGNPQYSLPPTVHIAGTNGKGSTIAFLRAMAEAQGLKVHVYTSPHLVSFCERIVLAGEMVSEEQFIGAVEQVKQANNGEALSFFEAVTAAAFVLFSETYADILILETGLGGRFDASNVIDNPACVGITPVDYDHKEFLGNNLAEIAREKAGIIKPYAPVLSAEQDEIVRAVLERETNKLHTQIRFQNEHFSAYKEHGKLIYEDENTLLDLPLPNLRGNHQIGNAGLAIAIARTMLIETNAIAKGLQNAKWPARLQVLTKGKLARIANEKGAELWLDGGHNPHAGRALSAAMAEQNIHSEKPLVLIMAMLSNKDAGAFLDNFDGLASHLIAVPIKNHNSHTRQNLVKLAKARNIKANIADDLSQAINQAIDLSDKPVRILICGSLYLAGEVLAL